MGNPLSAYGEVWVVSVQNLVTVLLFWRYAPAAERPSTAAMLGMASVVALYALGSQALPPGQRFLLPSSNLPIMVVMRAAQIRENVRNGHTGLLSTASLVMNVASVLARVFTSLVLVGADFNLLRPQALSVSSNLLLVAQIYYYRAATRRAMRANGDALKAVAAKEFAEAEAAAHSPVASPQRRSLRLRTVLAKST
jgi:hypothetical protein